MTDQAQNLREWVQKQRRGDTGTRVISITSGKGGVGKTTLTINLALALGKRDRRVLVVDADFGLPNVDVMLGVSSEYDFSHVLYKQKSLKEIFTDAPYGVKFISGGSGIYDLLTLNEDKLREIMNNLLQMDDVADIIIFDTAAGISDNVIRLLRASDEAILITTPEPTALMDAYAMAKTLQRYPDRPPLKLVVNFAESVKEAQEALSSFTRIAKKYTNAEIEQLGYILHDPLLPKAVRAQVPLVISHPGSVAAVNIESIVDKLTSVSESRGGGFAEFMERFFIRASQG